MEQVLTSDVLLVSQLFEGSSRIFSDENVMTKIRPNKASEKIRFRRDGKIFFLFYVYVSGCVESWRARRSRVVLRGGGEKREKKGSLVAEAHQHRPNENYEMCVCVSCLSFLRRREHST